MTTVQKEIERKWKVKNLSAAQEAAFVVEKNAQGVIMHMEKPDVQYFLIRQAYEGDRRIRLTTNSIGEFLSGEYTRKAGEGLERKEVTTTLSENYTRVRFGELEDTGIRPILKMRCRIPHGEYFIEYDSLYGLPVEMKDKYEDYVEIEFPSVEEAEAFTDIPKWFGEEVTGQKEHNMASIFKMIQELK